MTKLNSDTVVLRETLAEHRGRSIIVELHPRYLMLRLKGTQQAGSLDYPGAFESALMRAAKLTATDIPAIKGRRKARGVETTAEANAKLYPRPARIADGWAEEGRLMAVLGPAIEVGGVSWTPVCWTDHMLGETAEAPTFFKTRAIEFTDQA